MLQEIDLLKTSHQIQGNLMCLFDTQPYEMKVAMCEIVTVAFRDLIQKIKEEN